MIFEPRQTENYRISTNERHKTMIGVSFKTFLCKKCGQPKKVSGRKSLGWKAGFQCAECAGGSNGR